MRTVAALMLAASLAALTGCSAAEEPAPEATASPTPTPIFASDEEALAAAEKAYTEYLAMSDEIAQDGGRDPERIREFVAANRLKTDLSGFDEYRSRKLKLNGKTRFESQGLQQYSGDSVTGATVVIYGCWDVGEVSVRTVDGTDVTPKDRQDRVPLEVTLVSRDGDPSELVLLEEAKWSGDSFCS